MTTVRWTSFFAFVFAALAIGVPILGGASEILGVVFAILALVAAVLGYHEDR